MHTQTPNGVSIEEVRRLLEVGQLLHSVLTKEEISKIEEILIGDKNNTQKKDIKFKRQVDKPIIGNASVS